MFLAASLEMSLRVAVISLPEQDEPIADGMNVQLAGWGDETLRVLSESIIGNELCGRMYDGIQTIKDTMLCTGFKEGNQVTCVYDEGSPLSANGTLFGVWTGRFGGATVHDYPDLYTRVASLKNWIQRNL